MTYVSVKVPEPDLFAVYELLLARSSRRSEAPAPAVAMDERPQSDDLPEEAVARIYRRVTDEGRDALKAGAELTGDFEYGQLEEAARVPNLGAALQSIAIQQAKDESGIRLFEKRRRKNKGYVYSMNPRVAAIIREL